MPAVVAIAITLLALALPPPHSTDSTTNAQFLHALGDHWHEYLAFVISFAVIGSRWPAHRRAFRYVIRMNHQVGALNLLWLLMTVLTPFATRLLAACLMLMNRAVIRGDLQRQETPEIARHPNNVTSLTIIVMFVLSIPVAFLFTDWALALWGAVPLLTRAIRWSQGRRQHAKAAAEAEPAGRAAR